MLKQLSIFAENTKGRMQEVTGILLREDINILDPLPMTVQNTELSAW